MMHRTRRNLPADQGKKDLEKELKMAWIRADLRARNSFLEMICPSCPNAPNPKK